MNKQIIASRLSRRHFIKYSSLAIGATALTGPYLVRGQNLNSRLNIAQIGSGGKGFGDRRCCLVAGENIVAMCDVNSTDLEQANRDMEQLSQKFPNAGRLPSNKLYRDYRKLLENEKSLDAVDVATPDHMHSIIAETAIKLGKHVYCQKPLTHDVYEARMLRELAKQYNVATQMGNQGSASDGLRRAVEVVHAGLIGHVHQAYVWTNRPIWPQGLDRPEGSDPVPDNLDWDLWLGTAPFRPFKSEWPGAQAGGRRRGGHVYQPFSWRGWQDFGTGALGDMACHTVNWPFRALKLGYPTEIEATAFGGSGQPVQMNKEMYPVASRIRFEFPAREGLPPVTFNWSDGGLRPAKELTADVEALTGDVSRSGCIMVGENGMVYSGDDGDQNLEFYVKLKGDKELMSGRNHPGAKEISQTIPRNAFPGSQPDERQHMEWIAAAKSGKHQTAYSNFDIAAYLTEIILLGCVALRTGKTLEWDGPGMKAKNAPEAAQFVRREYREGWKA
jgi:predicted dehydrogenase